jgi:GT2 family glycosyltransferase
MAPISREESCLAPALHETDIDGLLRLACASLPHRRGWYRISLEGLRQTDGTKLFLDFGLGPIRHHSLTLRRAGSDGNAGFVRLFRPLRGAFLREADINASTAPSIAFERLPMLSVSLRAALELPAFMLASMRPAPSRYDRPLRRWRCHGLHAVPFGNRAWDMRSSYQRWLSWQTEGQHVPRPSDVAVARGVDAIDVDRLNAVLEDEQYEWIAVSRGDVRMRPGALHALRNAADRAGAAVAYTDSDRIGPDGGRCDPYFRTGFSPERLLSEDWLGSLLLFRADVVRQVGGWRVEAGEGLHYDACLRIWLQLRASAFIHIPRVLASESGLMAPVPRRVIDSLRSNAIVTAGLPPAAFGLQSRSAGMVAGQTSVIIATRDRLDLLGPAVESLLSVTHPAPGEVIIVDNGSSDQATLRWLMEAAARDPRIIVLRDEGAFNFSRLNNIAAVRAKGRLLVFLNNDTEVVSPDWLETCGALALHREIGCTGPLLTYADGRIQHAGLVTGAGGIAAHLWCGEKMDASDRREGPLLTRTVSGLTAACMLVEKDKFISAGGFDEVNLPVAFNDLDLCLRLEASGLRNVFVPHVRIIHHESASRQTDLHYSGDRRFDAEFGWMRRRWGHRLDRDMYFPKILRLDSGVPALSWGERMD